MRLTMHLKTVGRKFQQTLPNQEELIRKEEQVQVGNPVLWDGITITTTPEPEHEFRV